LSSGALSIKSVQTPYVPEFESLLYALIVSIDSLPSTVGTTNAVVAIPTNDKVTTHFPAVVLKNSFVLNNVFLHIFYI
jgi:hypothetical protein